MCNSNRISYDIGIITVTSIILVILYSVSTAYYELLLAIPFILLSSAILVSQIIHELILYDYYCIVEIEMKINKLVDENILDILRNFSTL